MCVVCVRELVSIFQSAKAATLRIAAPPPRPGREPGLPPAPVHPSRRRPPNSNHPSLSALYLQHQRENPDAQTQCAPPQSGAGDWGWRGAGAAAPSRQAKWQECQIPYTFGKLWFVRVPASLHTWPAFFQDPRRKKEDVCTPQPCTGAFRCAALWCSAFNPLTACTKILQTSGSCVDGGMVHSLIPHLTIKT